MQIYNNLYIENLTKSYDKVSNNFFLKDDFMENDLKNSINLFTDESLNKKKPRPKRLNVYALLSGISFDCALKEKLFKIQNTIRTIIPSNLAYFVDPDNLGLEHCVFKWPDEKWDIYKENSIKKLLDLYNFKTFNLEIIGIQIHSDGCIIAKGYDPSLEMTQIRNFFKKNLNFLPIKQSEWSHIPLGRILEPIGKEKYKILKGFVKANNKKIISSYKIENYKFVYEKRWYMEEKKIIKLINV